MSSSTKRLLAIAAATVTAVACADLTGTPAADPLVLGPAFQTIPVGFSANSNSFDASGDAGLAFFPGTIDNRGGASFDRGGSSGGQKGGEKRNGEHRNGDHKGRDHHDGFGEGGIRGLLMGGGLGPDFIGKIAFGRGRGRGPFGIFDLPSTCTFSETSGRVTCPEFTKHDLTINVSFAFRDASGNAQPAFDTTTTNSVNVQTDVSGTKSRDDGAITSTVSHTSDRTVGGLAKGSTERTVDGTSQAHESTSGTRDDVAFTAVRDAADTTAGLVIPIVDGHPTIPSAGKVIRRMTVTITPEGGTPVTKSRREEVTFDGTNTISVKITQDGVTKNCTITLPGKELSCE
jgi:hypothetical protein